MSADSLIHTLTEYSDSDMLPMHMPGHKGKAFSFPNPYCIDITEIPGFDNLHDAQEILKASMDKAASIYKSDKSIYLVNGSTCGILSAIMACVPKKGHILLARNAHISAFHAVQLLDLRVTYLYPQNCSKYTICGSISPEEVKAALDLNPDISAVLIISPTYEGVLSDISSIAEICHCHNIPLIVDEAHGAHLPFSEELPASAISQGADIVIQSLHKTLPSFTQTAIMHIKSQFADTNKILSSLKIFETSSPSYLFLAAIEQCISYMNTEGKALLSAHVKNIYSIRKEISRLSNIQLLEKTDGVYDIDITRLALFTSADAHILDDYLRDIQHIQTEMALTSHIVCITTLCDTREDLIRLLEALKAADKYMDSLKAAATDTNKAVMINQCPKSDLTIAAALECPKVRLSLNEAINHICCEYIYAYPPGIPIILPGEILTQDIYSTLINLKCKTADSIVTVCASPLTQN